MRPQSHIKAKATGWQCPWKSVVRTSTAFPCNGPGFNPWLRNEDPASSVAQIPPSQRAETITKPHQRLLCKEAPEEAGTPAHRRPGSGRRAAHIHTLSSSLRPQRHWGRGLRGRCSTDGTDSLSPRRWAKERNVSTKVLLLLSPMLPQAPTWFPLQLNPQGRPVACQDANPTQSCAQSFKRH